jgi:hypothetical protein
MIGWRLITDRSLLYGRNQTVKGRRCTLRISAAHLSSRKVVQRSASLTASVTDGDSWVEHFVRIISDFAIGAGLASRQVALSPTSKVTALHSRSDTARQQGRALMSASVSCRHLGRIP